MDLQAPQLTKFSLYEYRAIGLRPFGVSFIYGGWDEHHGFQLYHSDPSGNYSGWKATSIGANTASAQGILRQEYKEDGMTLQEAKNLAMKVLSKTMDTTSLGSDKRKLNHDYYTQSCAFFQSLTMQWSVFFC